VTKLIGLLRTALPDRGAAVRLRRDRVAPVSPVTC
jgi:hypothetical protein